MKYAVTLLLLMLGSVFMYAQKTISGVVKNSDGENVPSASVTVEEPGKDAIIAYGISNSKGEYKVSFSSSEANVDLKIKAFNHKPQTKQVTNDNHKLNFTLQTEATEIQEVKLKTKIITKKGDTITYDLKAFETKNDRTLADVLSKMPGIEVNTDGSILYQGQPLAKFYVNGKDLMEGGYGVINNSLPKDAVQKVEVLENHQPVKILQDKVPSDQAAINIKLKNKVTMTGRGEVGSGFADPWLWNVKLTPMFFGQKNQWVVNYKTNNVGETVENEGGMFAMGNRWEGMRRSISQSSWLSVERADIPSLPEKRYLMNNVHFLTANILTTPFENKEWELKASGSYTNNAVERESYEETFNKENGNTSIGRQTNNLYTNKAKGELIFTKNAKQGFFKNTTTFNQFWNADRATTLFRNPPFIDKNSAQALESPTTSFQNSLSTIIPLKSKMLNVMSYINYQNDNQDLWVTPGDYVVFPVQTGGPVLGNLFDGKDRAFQDFGIKTFEANHSATMGFTTKGWTFTPEIGLNYNTSKLNSQLFGYTGNTAEAFGDMFINDLKFTETVPYAGLGVNYKSEAWTLGIQMPVNFNIIKAEDPARNLHKDFTKTTFEPSGFVQYSFASFWKAMLTGNMNYGFAGIDDIYSGFMMRNPNMFRAMEAGNPLLESSSRRAGTRVEYRNPLNNLFFNVNYSISKSNSNLIADQNDVTQGFGLVRYIVQDNSTLSNSQSAEIGKYFPKFKSNVSASFRNSVSESDLSYEGTPYTNRNSTQSLGFKFNNAYFDWMTLDYNFTMGWGKNTGRWAASSNRSYNHNLGATFFPVEGHSVAFNWDQINSSQMGRNYRNGFYDLTYQFAWTEKKVDFELKWLNIANKKVFETISDGALYTRLSRINIRPSQVMFTVKFNFK